LSYFFYPPKFLTYQQSQLLYPQGKAGYPRFILIYQRESFNHRREKTIYQRENAKYQREKTFSRREKPVYQRENAKYQRENGFSLCIRVAFGGNKAIKEASRKEIEKRCKLIEINKLYHFSLLPGNWRQRAQTFVFYARTNPHSYA